MRGKQNGKAKDRDRLRITPAGAGKTIRLQNGMQNRQDHPRRCGENQTPTSVAQRADRITPAGAGKTKSPFGGIRRAWDHPRRCGENGQRRRNEAHTQGSPPQVRGKLFILYYLYQYFRITPAGAGKTGLDWNKLPLPTDHPRRCGENTNSKGEKTK